ncbi:IQ motif, EF-hand binding site [Artemisia annua]|uniref:IQ motif, EF-hand binding site n=1 Tax=Artemisia annua TaxID=35608 RepID=A0A2U1L6K9_ARTAN|nr:IQ motif, EF-hand binding site [Artemisia annua]
MAQNSKANEKPVYAALQSFPCKEFSDDQPAFYRSWILRKNFLIQKQAAVDIQSLYRGWVLDHTSFIGQHSPFGSAFQFLFMEEWGDAKTATILHVEGLVGVQFGFCFGFARLSTVLGSSAPPLSVKLMQVFSSGSKDASVLKQELQETNEVSIMSASDYVDALHNFLLSQNLTTLLGNFPVCNCHDSCFTMFRFCKLVIYLNIKARAVIGQQINFHKLLGHNQTSERKCVNETDTLKIMMRRFMWKKLVRTAMKIMEWCKEMPQNNKANEKPIYAALQSFPCKEFSDDQPGYHYKPFVFIYLSNLFLLLPCRIIITLFMVSGNAAKIIQSHFRRLVEHRNYTRTKKATN